VTRGPLVPIGPLDLHDYIRADRVDAGYVFAVIRFEAACSSVCHFFDAAVERGGNSVPEMKERIFSKPMSKTSPSIPSQCF